MLTSQHLEMPPTRGLQEALDDLKQENERNCIKQSERLFLWGPTNLVISTKQWRQACACYSMTGHCEPWAWHLWGGIECSPGIHWEINHGQPCTRREKDKGRGYDNFVWRGEMSWFFQFCEKLTGDVTAFYK